MYGQIKDGLSLGLNAADCELISVESESDANGAPLSFTLIMRRFGHGVGMSQRGAQWMAGHYDKGWQEILGFYYPGMSVQRMAWPDQGPSALEDLPDGVGGARPKPTPRPSPAPLPLLEEGEYYAVVTATTLNVRQSPAITAKSLAQLEKGRRVIVCGGIDSDGWVPIRTAEVAGFVKAEYLEME